MPKAKAKTQELTLSGSNSVRFTIKQPDGITTATTIPFEGVSLIRRYASNGFSDTKTFLKSVVKDALSWMRRMTNGPEMFELNTMDYWIYCSVTNTISLKNPSKQLRDFEVIFDCAFCKKDIDTFNQGLGMIMSSQWYQTHLNPLSIVELIASFDILFRDFHHGTSPAVAVGIPTVRLAEKDVKPA